MSRADVLAIRAYLKTVAPVQNQVVANTLPFPFNIRTAMRAWDALFFTDGEFKPDPQKSPEWNRGAYLVQGPAHCGACHTPKNFLGGDKMSEFLRGGSLQGWFAPDITNGPTTGLGSWSISEIVAYLHSGHNLAGGAVGPMAEEIAQSSSQMREDDLTAIATYLKSLPGRNEAVAQVDPHDPAMRAGEAIYRDVCSACHGIDRKGVPQLFPSLVDSPAVRAADPITLIRLVLRGARSVATDKEPTAPGMPSFGWQLDDAKVAAVLTYIRNVDKRAAPAVTAEAVKKARRSLEARSD
jgi:mono/diheme cytochrome c family protein